MPIRFRHEIASAALRLGVALLLSLFAAAFAQPADWTLTNWKVRKLVTNMAPAVGSAVLTNYPLLVYLSNESFLRSSPYADGRDITFATPGGAQLFHEVEYFDKATGRLSAWVNVPFFSSASAIYLYLSNASGSFSFSGSNAEGSSLAVTGLPTLNTNLIWTNVWDSNYLAVHHFGNYNSTIKQFPDSTRYGVQATNRSTKVTAGTNGIFGPSADFADPTNINFGTSAIQITNSMVGTSPRWGMSNISISTMSYLALPPSAYLTNGSIGGTTNGIYDQQVFKFWIFSGSSGTGVMSRLHNASNNNYNDTTCFFKNTGLGGNKWSNEVSNWHSTSFDANWTPSRTNATLFTNMTICKASSNYGTMTNTPVLGTRTGLHIGGGAGQNPWVGNFDEVRISDMERGIPWILTEQSNWRIPLGQTFYTLGTNEVGDLTAPVLTPSPSADMVTNLDFVFTLGINEGTGFWSTNNGVTWNSFTTSTTVGFSNTGNIRFYGVDAWSNVSATNALSFTVGVDNTPPTISNTLSGSFTTNAVFTATLGVSESTGYWTTNAWLATNSFTLGNANVIVSNTVTLAWYARDLSGNAVPTNSATYTLDLVAPVLVVPTNFVTNGTFTTNVSVNEDFGWLSTTGPSSFGAFPASTGTNLTFSAATNTVWYFGRDLAGSGNTTVTNSNTYLIESAAPVASNLFVSLTTNTFFTNRLFVSFGTGWWTTNGWATATSFTNSPAGTNLVISNGLTNVVTLQMYGAGTFFTSATNSFVFTFDTSAPVLFTSNSATNVGSLTFAFGVDEGSLFWSTNGWLVTNVLAGPATNSVTVANQSVTLLTWALDTAGNRLGTNTNVYVSDSTAPVVTTSPGASTNSIPFRFVVSTGETNGFWSTNGGANWTTVSNVPSTNWVSNGVVTLLTYGIDFLGNVSATNSTVYSVDTNYDSAPPVLSYLGMANGWTTNRAFTVQLLVDKPTGYYSRDGGANFSSFGPGAVTLSIGAGVTTLSAYARSVNGFSTATNVWTFTNDQTAPVVSGLDASKTVSAPFTVNLSVDEPQGFWSTNNLVTSNSFSNAASIDVARDVMLFTWAIDRLGNASTTNLASYRFAPVVTLDVSNSISGLTNGKVVTGGRLAFSFAATKTPVIEIYSLGGGLVRRLGVENGSIDLANRRAAWDGITQWGKKADSGVYVVILKVDGKVIDQRKVVITP